MWEEFDLGDLVYGSYSPIGFLAMSVIVKKISSNHQLVSTESKNVLTASLKFN